MKQRLPITLVSKCTFVQALGFTLYVLRLTKARLAFAVLDFSRIVRAYDFCQHGPVTNCPTRFRAIAVPSQWLGSAGISVYEFSHWHPGQGAQAVLRFAKEMW